MPDASFTEVPRQSAGGVGAFVRWYIHTYVVRNIRSAHVRVMEAEISIALTIHTSEHIYSTGMALRNGYGFHEYTYQDGE